MYSRTPSMSGTTLYRLLTGRPQPRSRSYQPDWVSGAPSRCPSSPGPAASPLMPSSLAEPSTRPMPCTMASSARDAVIRGSFCRSDPAAELRGLANAALPASSSDSFSLPNASTGMNTSPLTSRIAGCPEPFSRAGMEEMVRMFGVTSSPVRPSPRVAALTSAPSR